MAGTKYVSTPKLENYKKQFEEHLVLERKDGILQVRLSTHGGPLKWSFQAHQAFAEAWSVIGHDPENEIVILTGTDPYWIGEFDHESFKEVEQDTDPSHRFFSMYHDATKILENFVFDIDVPTIAAINGPGLQTEYAFMSDITICTPDFMVGDDHFGDATVPGDGQSLALQAALGIKRASYMMYMVHHIDAKTALDWGIVNEVVPKDKLLPRAWEIAYKIKKQPAVIRRLTHQVTIRPWKRWLMDDFQMHMGHEMYGIALLKIPHHFDEIKDRWIEPEKKKK